MSIKYISTVLMTNTVEVVGDSPQELIKNASFFESLPERCPMCEAALFFTYKSPKGNDYYGLQCRGEVPHETFFGQVKDADKTLFYKGGAEAIDKERSEKAKQPVPVWQVAYAFRNQNGNGGGSHYEEDYHEPPRQQQQAAPPAQRAPAQAAAPAQRPNAAATEFQPASDGQKRMITALCEHQKLDPDVIADQLAGVPLSECSMVDARSIIESLKGGGK